MTLRSFVGRPARHSPRFVRALAGLALASALLVTAGRASAEPPPAAQAGNAGDLATGESGPDERFLRAGLWRPGEGYVPAVVLGVRAASLPGRAPGSDLLGLFLFSKRASERDLGMLRREPSLCIAPLRLTGGVWGVLAEGSF